jgi:hypothetical protein
VRVLKWLLAYIDEIFHFKYVHERTKLLEAFNFIFVSYESVNSVASAHQISDNAGTNVSTATLIYL